jgi:hypothetical protein
MSVADAWADHMPTIFGTMRVAGWPKRLSVRHDKLGTTLRS